MIDTFFGGAVNVTRIFYSVSIIVGAFITSSIAQADDRVFRTLLDIGSQATIQSQQNKNPSLAEKHRSFRNHGERASSVDRDETFQIQKKLNQPDFDVGKPKLSTSSSANPSEGTEPFVPNLPMVGPAVLLMSLNTQLYSQHFGNVNQAEAAKLAVKKFGDLYLLKAVPGVLDTPRGALAFLSLVPVSEAEKYTTNSVGGTNWKGANQFEIEDTRQAFLDANKNLILAKTEKLPNEIVEVRGFEAGRYDAKTGELSFKIDGIYWLPGRLSAPLPYILPSTWKLDALTARKTVEALSEGYAVANPGSIAVNKKRAIPRGVVALHQKIVGVRSDGNGAVLDLAAVSIKVYGGPDLKVLIGEIPLPENAVKAEPTPSRGQQDLVTFDSMYPRLWAVKNDPSLLDNQPFLLESFEIRRQLERDFAQRKVDRISFRKIVSNALLHSNATPQPADIERMRAWLAENSVNLSNRALVGGLTLRDRETVNVLEEVTLNGRGFGTFAGRNRGWINGARRAAGEALPNSDNVILFWAGDAVPAMVALHPHPAWSGVALGFTPNFEKSSLEVQIVSTQIIPDGQGKGFVLFDILPEAINFVRNGETGRIELTPPEQVATDSAYDIAGVSLGMPLAKAEETAIAFLGGTPMKSNWAFSYLPLADAIAFEMPNSINKGGSPEETLVIFYDKAAENSPVIAVGRRKSIAGFNSANEAFSAISEKVEQKFGSSSGTISSSLPTAVWAQSNILKARVKKGIRYNNPCSNNRFRNFYLNPAFNHGFGDNDISMLDCGEVLTLTVAQDAFDQFLTNTSVLKKRVEREMKNVETPPPPANTIKF